MLQGKGGAIAHGVEGAPHNMLPVEPGSLRQAEKELRAHAPHARPRFLHEPSDLFLMQAAAAWACCGCSTDSC